MSAFFATIGDVQVVCESTYVTAVYSPLHSDTILTIERQIK